MQEFNLCGFDVLRALPQGRIDPAQFDRIHGSRIVRIDRIRFLLSRRDSDYGVELKDGRVLTLNQYYSPALLDRLDMSPGG